MTNKLAQSLLNEFISDIDRNEKLGYVLINYNIKKAMKTLRIKRSFEYGGWTVVMNKRTPIAAHRGGGTVLIHLFD